MSATAKGWIDYWGLIERTELYTISRAGIAVLQRHHRDFRELSEPMIEARLEKLMPAKVVPPKRISPELEATFDAAMANVSERCA